MNIKELSELRKKTYLELREKYDDIETMAYTFFCDMTSLCLNYDVKWELDKHYREICYEMKKCIKEQVEKGKQLLRIDIHISNGADPIPCKSLLDSFYMLELIAIDILFKSNDEGYNFIQFYKKYSFCYKYFKNEQSTQARYIKAKLMFDNDPIKNINVYMKFGKRKDELI